MDHCRKNLARHKVPVEVKVHLITCLAAHVGKVLRRELIRSIVEKQD